MLSRWTSKKDPSAGGPSLGDKGQQLAQETAGHDGLTPSERTTLEGMERFYGMENFGNTCYANSVVQALFHCHPFRDLVNAYPSHPPSGSSHLPSSGPISLQIPQSAPSSSSSGPSSPLNAHSSANAIPPLQNASATRTSRWPGAKRVSSFGSSAPSASASPDRSTLEPPARKDRSRSPSRTRERMSLQPSNPPPATLFIALQALFRHISSIPPPSYTISPNKDKDGNPPTPVPSVTKVIAPAAFIAKLKVENVMFQGTMQQDAHEFLNFLLNKIGEDLAADDRERRAAAKLANLSRPENMTDSTGSVSTFPAVESRGPEPTLVQKLFEGTLVNETRCLTCETTSSRDESFLDLSIDIEQNTSVTACLRQFSARETLCQKNKFYCDTCCGLQEAEKRMKVKTLPNVLALHLKRFKYQEDLGRYIKLSYRVVFPFHLRLPNTSDDTQNPDRLYELFAFVVHVGGGPHHGHYIAIVKTSAGWLMFDDVNVSPVDEADIQRYFGESNSGSGYVLFYQAVDLDPSVRPNDMSTPSSARTPASSVQRSTSPSPPDSLSLSQPALVQPALVQPDSPVAPPVSHVVQPAPPTLAPVIVTPPPQTPTPPSEFGDNPSDLPPSHGSLPRERFASAPASMPAPARRSSEYASLSRSGSNARARHSSSTAGHSDSQHPPDNGETSPRARRRFSSLASTGPSSAANPAAPPSNNFAYLQSLATNKPMVETKEEKKKREQAEKEREKQQKEREKAGREREKEREKAEKEREKQRKEEEKAEAARVAKLEKEMEKRQRMSRKTSMSGGTSGAGVSSESKGPIAKIGGLGRSSSMAFRAFGKKVDKDA